MFGMSMGSRTARGLAAAALILSLTATTFAGSANAAPLANTQACKIASQARNDAMSALRDAWKASASDLKALSKGTPELRHELMSAWRDLRSVLMQAVQDLKDLGLGSACQHENEDGAPTMGAATTTTDTTTLEAKAKAIIDQAIKDLQAVVDAARKSVADQTAAGAPKDSTDAANGDKDSQKGNQGHDEDATANNEDKNGDGDSHQSATSKDKSTSVDKAKSLKKSTNLAKMKTGHRANEHERD